MTANSPLASALQVIGRIAFAFIFIMSGAGKLADHVGQAGYIASGNMPIPTELAYWSAVVVELGGGILIAVGLFARPVAFVTALFTLAAAYYFHLPYANGKELVNLLQQIHVFKNISLAGAALFIAGSGAGPWSLDAKIFGGRG